MLREEGRSLVSGSGEQTLGADVAHGRSLPGLTSASRRHRTVGADPRYVHRHRPGEHAEISHATSAAGDRPA